MDNFSEMSCTLLNIPQVSIHSRQFQTILDISKLCQNLNEFIQTKQVAKNKFKHNICTIILKIHWKNSMFFAYGKLIAFFVKSIILDKNCQKQPRLFFSFKSQSLCLLYLKRFKYKWKKKSWLFPIFFSCYASMMLEIRPMILLKWIKYVNKHCEHS